MLTPEQGAGPGIAGALRQLAMRTDPAPAETPVTIFDSMEQAARLAKRVWWQSRKIRQLLTGLDVGGANPGDDLSGTLQECASTISSVLRAVDQEQLIILNTLGGQPATTRGDVEEALEDLDRTLREKSEQVPPAGGKPIMRGGPELE